MKAKALLSIGFSGMLLGMQFVPACSSTYDEEIITMFKRGVVQMPSAQIIANVQNVGFSPAEIRDTLIAYTATAIKVCFPDHEPADSFFISPRDPNLRIKKMELDLIYKISLTNASNRNQLNAALESMPEVIFSCNNGTITYSTQDDLYPQQWALEHPMGYDIDGPGAW